MSNDGLVEVDCEFIQAAGRRANDMHPAGREPLEPPSLQDFSQMLGEDALSCTLLGENWRNRVYRVRYTSGRVAIAKQLVVAPDDEMVRRQHNQHAELAKLPIPKLRVPRALAILPAKQIYLMDCAPGQTIEALVGRGTQKELLGACALAGEVLAQMQLAQVKRSCPLPVEALARDFATAPWRLTARQERTLASAFEQLAPALVDIGPIYYDFKPANTLFYQDMLYLIDPPDVLHDGIHLWDFSLFRSSMRRHLWKYTLRHPLGRERHATILAASRAFTQSYVAALPNHGAGRYFEAIVWLLELQRTGVLLTMQQGKALATSNRGGAGGVFGHPIANRVSVTLLNIEKQWLFQRLARALKTISA